ncbi:MAG TPA: MBOAT family O-acyltransferase [Gemmatimonadota bacterium]|nr:MBOAT family O-acyltransferase [Gemmatimonadota bacterium]
MLFNSLTFLVFFAAVLALHRLPLSWTTRKANLLLASYLFYAAWNPPFVILIWISTLVDWFAARAMARTDSRARRRVLLTASLCVNLGLLGFFKYGGFLLDNFVGVLGWLGVEYQPLRPDIILPVGISFYTFQTMSYSIDVYRGVMRPWRSFLDFALYVTFFPQLVAGPIVRSGQFLPQCLEPRRATGAQLGWGLTLLTVGLFEKVVLADRLLGPVADYVYGAAAGAGFTQAWLGTLAFSGQIFFDFAGYSTCAIGIGLCLGFVLPDNFRFPYAAIGFSDFWRRWHISLSSWLRDYLYISLGGNRKGRARTYGNLMLTMLLGGLWHGANWRFVVWGGLHGVYLSVERLLRDRWRGGAWLRRWPFKLALALLTYMLVCIAWVFFRAPDFATAISLVSAMLTGAPGALPMGPFQTASVIAVTVGLLGAHWAMRDASLEQGWARLSWPARALLLAALLVALAVSSGDTHAFIYFQF